jgi:D-alanyl-D-alanine dipeptidase
VLNPQKGSRHNRGAAVDLTLADLDGKPLKMPSAYDDFSEKAHVNYQNCDEESKKNRDLLQNIMTQNGFLSFETEWWHFDFSGWERFPLLDVPFEKVKDICN